MANIVNFSTYGFLNDILALNEENWRRFFKPVIYDSVQSGLEVSAGTGMVFNISTGECRCGSIMGISNTLMLLDIDIGDSTYNRIDSIVIQYTYNSPSVLSATVLKGTASSNPVPPTLTKSYNSVWQMEIAEILIPANATSASQCTIIDKRKIFDSLDSIFDSLDSLTSSIDVINDEILSLTSSIDVINDEILSLTSSIDVINDEILSVTSSIDVINDEILSVTSSIDVINDEIDNKILYYTNQTVSAATTAQIMRIPASGTDNNITADTVVLECTFAAPANIASDVSWQSYAGYITFTGTCTTATTANVTLGTKGN